MTRLSPWALLICLTLVAAPLSTSAQDDPPEEDSDTVSQMHQNLFRVSNIMAQIIQGNLGVAQSLARRLTRDEAWENMPEQGRPFVDQIQANAMQILDTNDLGEAAHFVGIMGRNCGNCHLTFDVMLDFGFDQPPQNSSDMRTHMQRHQWSVDRMWAGLIGPSDQAWRHGSYMLIDEPIASGDVLDRSMATNLSADELAEAARLVHEIGANGANALSLRSRAVVFGELIGLCADCHSATGGGPGR